MLRGLDTLFPNRRCINLYTQEEDRPLLNKTLDAMADEWQVLRRSKRTQPAKNYMIQSIKPYHHHQLYFDELAKIWEVDKRIPTLKSRRAWAIARGIDPPRVHNWWSRRKKLAEKAGATIADESYDLEIGLIYPKVESVDVGLETDTKATPQPESPALTSDTDTDAYTDSDLPSDLSDAGHVPFW